MDYFTNTKIKINAKAYVCDICEKSFISNMYLKVITETLLAVLA